jgi:hypothetical protein
MKQKKVQLDEVKTDLPAEGVVQSFDPGSTGKPRKRRIRGEQTLKEGMKAHFDKMSKGLRY